MLMRRLAFRGGGGGGGVTIMCLTRRGASDYSGSFKDRESFEERRWVQKHEQEVASIAAERKKEMETMPPLHAESVEVGDPGTSLYFHQSNKVVALEELEEILEAFPGLSESLPHDLKRLLVTWRVDALYRVSSGHPNEFAPTVDMDGSMTTADERTILPPEYAPTWLFESISPLEYKLQRYVYDKMQFDHDVEPVEHHIDRGDPAYKAIKGRVIAKKQSPSKGKASEDKDVKKP